MYICETNIEGDRKLEILSANEYCHRDNDHLLRFTSAGGGPGGVNKISKINA